MIELKMDDVEDEDEPDNKNPSNVFINHNVLNIKIYKSNNKYKILYSLLRDLTHDANIELDITFFHTMDKSKIKEFLLNIIYNQWVLII